MDISDFARIAMRSAGDLAGVFEYDGETSYFYLYRVTGGDGEKVLDSLHVFSGEPDFDDSDILIQWDQREQRVGLFIRSVLWAVFNVASGQKAGGAYRVGGSPAIPEEACFDIENRS